MLVVRASVVLVDGEAPAVVIVAAVLVDAVVAEDRSKKLPESPESPDNQESPESSEPPARILLKEREIHAAILAVINETGMAGKVIPFSMLQNKKPIGQEHVALEHQVRNVVDVGQRVGWVGKDEVILLVARSKELKDIASNGEGGLVAQFLYKACDETIVQGVFLHANHTTATTREKFQRDASRTCKKVEGAGVL